MSHPDVRALAKVLRRAEPTDAGFARAAYHFARDEVAHSVDVQDPRVPCAPRRSCAIASAFASPSPTCWPPYCVRAESRRGLCYQRLGGDGSFTLHGLVAVHLDGVWHRQDPRGNKPGVDAQFSLGPERLAWPVDRDQGDTRRSTSTPTRES